mgnify:CR=1 FL=1
MCSSDLIGGGRSNRIIHCIANTVSGYASASGGNFIGGGECNVAGVIVSNDFDIPRPHKEPDKIKPIGLTNNTNNKNPIKK